MMDEAAEAEADEVVAEVGSAAAAEVFAVEVVEVDSGG
jgi:hypothetical protein